MVRKQAAINDDTDGVNAQPPDAEEEEEVEEEVEIDRDGDDGVRLLDDEPTTAVKGAGDGEDDDEDEFIDDVEPTKHFATPLEAIFKFTGVVLMVVAEEDDFTSIHGVVFMVLEQDFSSTNGVLSRPVNSFVVSFVALVNTAAISLEVSVAPSAATAVVVAVVVEVVVEQDTIVDIAFDSNVDTIPDSDSVVVVIALAVVVKFIHFTRGDIIDAEHVKVEDIVVQEVPNDEKLVASDDFFKMVEVVTCPTIDDADTIVDVEMTGSEYITAGDLVISGHIGSSVPQEDLLAAGDMLLTEDTSIDDVFTEVRVSSGDIGVADETRSDIVNFEGVVATEGAVSK